jgi:hypothetical protein
MESFLAELPDWARNLFYVLAVCFAAWLFVYGKFQPQRAKSSEPGREQTLEVAGALVDSGAIKMLTAAIEAHNALLVQLRIDEEKRRKLGHDLVESLDAMTKELSEIRNEMRIRRATER